MGREAAAGRLSVDEGGFTMSETAVVPAKIGSVTVRSFIAAAPEDTIGETAEKMASCDTESALVVDMGRLIGIFTSRDLLRAIADRAHPSEARIRDWMSADPVTATEETSFEEARRLMVEHGIHHLPVVAGAIPVGVVGLRSVAVGD
jgi:CBS domain-containing protein